MKKITVLMIAMLAVVTTLTAGLTVLPGSVQEAQANPCSVYAGDTVVTGDANDADLDCDFEEIGSLEIDEGGLCCPAATETDDTAATETDDTAATETDDTAATETDITDNPLFDLADVFDESD